MTFIISLIGFLIGFGVSLMALRIVLRHKSAEELRNDTRLHWRYGTLCWIIAFASAYAFTQLYLHYFI